ncbi:MAG: efflux RND transporter periplasmic adaptor subunit [Chloroflexota bacterium]
MKLKILAIVALAVVGIGAVVVAAGGLPKSNAATTQYLTGTVQTGDVTDEVAATGTVATSASYGLAFGSPAHLASSTADSSGGGSTTWTVTEVKPKVGDTVKKGDVLAKADTADLKRQLADANTAIDTAKISLRAAKADLSDANDADVTAQIRQAKISVNNAETQLSSARQTRDDLTEQIKLATLTAPIDGIVTAVNVMPGLDAPSGDAIVVDAKTFEITADVVESDLASMSVGQAAAVTISAVDADVAGTVTAIAPTAVGDTSGNVVSYAVTVSLTDVPATVRAGMTADVTITIANAANVLTVPAASLRGNAGNYSVLVMGPDGTPAAQPVEVGLVTNTTAEIKSGVTEGQAVVTGVANAQTGNPTTTGGFGGGGVGFPGGGFGGGGVRRGNGN